MAMNKAEKKQLEDAKLALEIERAMGWPRFEEPKPQELAPLAERGYGYKQRGFAVIGEASDHPHIEETERDQFCHRAVGSSSASQGSGTQYKTKLEALRAARWHISRRVARELAWVDRMIEQHEKELAPSTDKQGGLP